MSAAFILSGLDRQAADADDTFAESVRLRHISELVDSMGAAAYLAGQPPPRTTKVPRLVRTLGRGQSFLAPYKPLPRWVIRDREAALESKRKRGVPRVSVGQQLLEQSLAGRGGYEILEFQGNSVLATHCILPSSNMAIAIAGRSVIFDNDQVSG